ncbi:serine hydrolase domain-containing protein [Chryseobacterium sp. CBo1]|uniref:serine hydrolase domain-containing protein n=1 Tax=Chryseobacterium sp. CBo1 TaxID=1869230 RepID=UPI0009F6FAA2|nr:serine hydrolase [Chryseobacterium sp. CBo1]
MNTKKVLIGFLAGTTAVAATICICGYGYIFKALRINLKKGSLTPSTDDEEKFPSNPVSNFKQKSWQKHSDYNKKQLSSTLLEELEKTSTSSLVVIKNNKIIHEKYWKDHDPSSLMNSFSMAKGILSVLTGFAIDDGYLDSEDQLFSSVFPQYSESKYGKYLTFKHLMTMQAGFDWEEEYNHPFAENSKQYFVDDLAEQTFKTEIKEMPGEKYQYQSVAPQLLGLALKKVTGKSLADYLSEKIWQPLGMESVAKWSTDEKGMEKAFCCIHAIPRDFAKIGQLILQNGNWEGKQLIDQKYCEKLLHPTPENDAFCYNVWADNESKIKLRFFYGFLGQFIIMIPSENIIIVKTGIYNRLDVDQKKRPLQVKILAEEICSIFSD